jgi:hypothetical protein
MVLLSVQALITAHRIVAAKGKCNEKCLDSREDFAQDTKKAPNGALRLFLPPGKVLFLLF